MIASFFCINSYSYNPTHVDFNYHGLDACSDLPGLDKAAALFPATAAPNDMAASELSSHSLDARRSSRSSDYTDKSVPLNDSVAPPSASATTAPNSFYDLVAWFPKGVHPTATYAWSKCRDSYHIAPAKREAFHYTQILSLSIFFLYRIIRNPSALHKGRLATLTGVESGSQTVDVVFCRPGDPLLTRYA